MSVIQQIRDKYARLSVILIAIAMVGFILIDYVSGKGSGIFSGGNSTTIGKVNGVRINADEFRLKVKQQEDYEQQNPGQFGKRELNQIVDAVWNQEVSQTLLSQVVSKLGMQIGAKELNDIMFGANPPEDIKRLGTDPQTGVYSSVLAVQQINAIKKRGTREDKDRLNEYIQQLEAQKFSEKYSSMLANSTNFPKWLIEKQNTDNSLLAKISLVRVPYTDSMFVDSTIKISDAEISGYINKHKEEFKQNESRSIMYVAFNATASSEDTAAIKEQINSLRTAFDTTKDIHSFLAINGSAMPFFDGYVGKNQMQQQYKDSITRLPKNAVFGPYIDGQNLILAKMIDIKTLPDSVKCRHILIGTTNPQTGQVLTDDSVAHKRIDSIANAIRNGANFDTLETKFSTDQAAHLNKGVMTFSSVDIQGENFAKEFGQFILFDGKPGDKKVVKTAFGWHYIEILKFINPEPHYQVAYLAKTIEPSSETDNNANNEATLFAGNSRDVKSFEANYEKELKPKGINKLIANNIDPNAYSINGIAGNDRQFIKSIYDASLGEVLQPERIGDQYIVAVVTEVNKEGTQSPEKARPRIEPLLRNQKKAEIFKQKLGAITTLEAAATILKKTIETIDSLRMQPDQRIAISGHDPKVIGAAFNPANKGKVVPQPIAGVYGIYIERVDDVTATPVENADVSLRQKTLYQNALQTARFSDPLGVMRTAATIKDYRSKFY
ncbi:MAG: SurA N-terminal domain-containing protein [Bacteroidetes bacterium]|nr:SurA N-terminal domain-containing protein [Bacteroidota bacterium]